MAKKSNKNDKEPGFEETMAAKRHLIVITKRETGLRASNAGIFSVQGADVTSMESVLVNSGAKMEPLFGVSEETLYKEAQTANPDFDIEHFNLPLFYFVDAPDDRLEELAGKLQELEQVEAAYVQPAVELPIAPSIDEEETKESSSEVLFDSSPENPAFPPDFTPRQGYLNVAPGGIDARFAWTQPGGRGRDVNIIDLENGFRFTHMDLRANQGGLLAGTSSSDDDHGTAVLGEFSGDRNAFGITGICSDARASAVSWFSMTPARAIRTAANRLRSGDIMLLEGHLPGPRFNFQRRSDQQGYIAIEWWPDIYEAVRDAVNRGILVVAAAGNGAQDLDDPLYNTNPSSPFGPFPSWWKNPFKRSPLDSGAILVGAGAPPPGTHGRSGPPDRSRLDFSNYGAAIDAQGWGREVTTTGYGLLWKDPDDPDNRDRWYRDTFSGTSSAAPIVTGALGCVQGIMKARGRIPLSPARARELLRATGSPQQDAPGRPRMQRIGNRPNLRQLIARALETRTWVGVQFTGTIPANRTQRWFTFRWPAHWHVVWTVVPTSPRSGSPQIKWKVQVERASDQYITYWISITNLTPVPVSIEARYAVLGW